MATVDMRRQKLVCSLYVSVSLCKRDLQKQGPLAGKTLQFRVHWQDFGNQRRVVQRVGLLGGRGQCRTLNLFEQSYHARRKCIIADKASVLQCVAVCCSVLQCVAVCCSVLQCRITQDARALSQTRRVCCSVLQCVAVCCSVVSRKTQEHYHRQGQ